MATESEMTKILKVLSGIHQGAELELAPGRTLVFGSSEDCDIALDDPLVALEHLRLSSNETNGPTSITFLQPGFVGEEFYPAGKSVTVPDMVVVSFGQTQFAVGTNATQWTQIKLPDWQILRSKLAESDQGSEALPESEAGESNGESPEEVAAESVTSPNPTQSQPSPVTSVSAEPLATPKNKKYRYVSTMAGLALVGAAVAGLLFSQFIPSRHINATASQASVGHLALTSASPKVRETCERLGLQYRKDKGLQVVSGMLKNQEDVRKARAELRALDPHLSFRVVAEDEMLKSAEQVIRGFGFPIAVTVGQDATLQLTGAAPDERQMENVLTRLRSDVPGVNGFDVKVELLSQVSDALTSELAALNLKDVRLEINNGLLQARGTIPATASSRWKEKLSEWQARYSLIEKVEDRTEQLSVAQVAMAEEVKVDAPPPLTSPIASIRQGEIASFKTSDGRMYFPNAVVDNGYIVDSIASDGIWVRPSTDTSSTRSWISLGHSRPTKEQF